MSEVENILDNISLIKYEIGIFVCNKKNDILADRLYERINNLLNEIETLIMIESKTLLGGKMKEYQSKFFTQQEIEENINKLKKLKLLIDSISSICNSDEFYLKHHAYNFVKSIRNSLANSKNEQIKKEIDNDIDNIIESIFEFSKQPTKNLNDEEIYSILKSEYGLIDNTEIIRGRE
jgi:hypothetical protein